MKNKQLAIDAIRNDCEVQASYFKNGKTCAIGCLGRLAGYSNDDMESCNDVPIGSFGLLANAIRKKFGLELSQMERIQKLNDYPMTLEDRRLSIVCYLQSLPED